MLNNTFKIYEENIFTKLRIPYKGLIWCELGNQTYKKSPAKQLYKSKGVKHTSIDINGLDGSLPLNLDLPIPNYLENKFDVITNYGTTEHVDNQYSVFRNIHVMAKINCVIIHGVPLVGQWPEHCRYYYSKLFFEQLATVCKYTVLDLHILTNNNYRNPYNLIACTFIKQNECNFVSSENFYSLLGLTDLKAAN